MRRSLSSLALLASLLAAAAPTAKSQAADPESGGAAFLLLPVGARATALGQAAAADGGTTEAAFWNPAGLASLPRSEIAVHFADTFVSDITSLAGYLAINRLGVIGVSAYLVDFGSQELVGGGGIPIGRLSPKNFEFLASFATDLIASLSFGLNYKLIQFRQDCSGQCGSIPAATGTTHGVDVGMQYALGRRDALRLGVVVRHAGFRLQLENQGQADPLPTRLQVGVVYSILLPRQRGQEQQFDARILFDLDEELGSYTDPSARVGLEVGYGDLVRIRSGYAFLDSESSGPSVGIGLRFGRFAVDLARVFFISSNFDEPLHISVRAYP